MNQATIVEPLEPEVMKRLTESGQMRTLSDYKIAKLKCPYCGNSWKAHIMTLIDKNIVCCPFCGAMMPK